MRITREDTFQILTVMLGLMYQVYELYSSYRDYQGDITLEQLTGNQDSLGYLSLTNAETLKLTEVAQFIGQVKADLSPESLEKIDGLSIQLTESEDVPLYAVRSPEPQIGISRKLLRDSEYPIEELEAGIGHELGHLLRNHFTSTDTALRYLCGQNLLMCPFVAYYLHSEEYEADKAAIELGAEPCALVSFLEKVSDISYYEQFFPLLEYFTSHPSNQKRAKALGVSIEHCSYFKTKSTSEVCESEALNNPYRSTL